MSVEGLDGLNEACVGVAVVGLGGSCGIGFGVEMRELDCRAHVIYYKRAYRDGEVKSESERERMERESPRV